MCNRQKKWKRLHKPSFIALSIVLGIGLVRLVYLTVYQYGFNVQVDEIAGRIMYVTVTFLQVSIQFLVLYVWLQVWQQVKPSKARLFKRLRIATIIALAFFFIVVITRSTVVSMLFIHPSIRRSVDISYFTMVIVVRCISALPIVILGRRLQEKLKKFDCSNNARKEILSKINFFVIVITVIGLVAISFNLCWLIFTYAYKSVLFIVFSELAFRLVEQTLCFAVLILYHQFHEEHDISVFTTATSTMETGK
jgi:hypothetical protein